MDEENDLEIFKIILQDVIMERLFKPIIDFDLPFNLQRH